MTDPLFLHQLPTPLPAVGELVELTGEEGHHAAVVRRIRVDEIVLIADGAGFAVRGPVRAVSKRGITIEVAEHLRSDAPALEITAVQALAKGDRSELAVEVMTETGVSRIVPWQASRSIVKWTADRAEKSLRRWHNTAREATKQSRRFRMPTVSDACTTPELVALIEQHCTQGGLAFVLHESAGEHLAQVYRQQDDAAADRAVLIIIGPEGGISDDEIAACTKAGARAVLVGDGVLRTSTAGVVAIAQLHALHLSGGLAAEGTSA